MTVRAGIKARFYYQNMAKTKVQKQQALILLEKRLKGAKSTVFATFTRMSISDQEALRMSLKEAGVFFSVFKKTLLEKVLKDMNVSESGIEEWEGNLGVATSDDEIAPAKVFVKSLKAYDGLKVRLGMLDGRIIMDAEIKELASLPSREELMSRLLGAISAPITQFVVALQANPRNVISVLSQIKKE